MRRRTMPALLTLLALMLDTAVIPFLIGGPYVVSLTFIVVLNIAMYMDRMHGMLYGVIAGLLLDILVGYQLGFHTVIFVSLGFLAGVIAYEPEKVRLRRSSARVYLRRGLTVAGMTLLREIVIFGYQYFNVALISGVYFVNILIRTLLTTALSLPLGVLQARIILGGGTRYRRAHPKREVRSF